MENDLADYVSIIVEFVNIRLTFLIDILRTLSVSW